MLFVLLAVLGIDQNITIKSNTNFCPDKTSGQSSSRHSTLEVALISPQFLGARATGATPVASSLTLSPVLHDGKPEVFLCEVNQKQSQPSIFICASLISSWSLDELWEMEDCQGGKVGGIRVLVERGKGYYPLGNMGLAGMNVTSSKTDERIDKLADQLSTLVEIVSKKVVTPAPVKAVEESCVTCGGAHSWYNCPATDNNQASVCATMGTYNQVNPPNRVSNQMTPPGFAPVQNNGQNSYKRNNDQMLRNMQSQINSLKGDLKNEIQNTIKSQQAVMMNQQTTFQNNLQNMICGLFQNQASTSGTLPSNTIPNPKGEMKAITTRSGVAYEGPSNPTNPSPKKVVERETEETTDKEQTNFQGSTTQIPPPVIPISIPEPDVPTTLPKTTPIPESDIPKSLPKPNIPYPSRRDDQKSRDKASNQMEKIFQIFQDLRFDISFADALLLMPRFAPTIKSLLMNKEKLLELAKIPLNENCSAMLLKKLPEKLGDPGKFLIPCNFPGMDVCHALADLGAKILCVHMLYLAKSPSRILLNM
ncbi:hypothetical protein Tco_0662235 [Tanacetum coccineum]